MAKALRNKVRKQLSKDAKEAINNNSDLHKAVADALGLAPSSMNTALYRNVIALNQQHIVKMISDHSGIPVDDILVDFVKKPAQQAAAV